MFIIDALWFSACDYLKNDRKKYYEALNQANGGNYQNFIDVSKLLSTCIYIHKCTSGNDTNTFPEFGSRT
jgi:hypothetical protein